MYDAKSGRNFLMKIGVVPAVIGRVPVIEPRALTVHNLPLVPPLPLPDYQAHLDGEPAPDRAGITEWPHP